MKHLIKSLYLFVFLIKCSSVFGDTTDFIGVKCPIDPLPKTFDPNTDIFENLKSYNCLSSDSSKDNDSSLKVMSGFLDKYLTREIDELKKVSLLMERFYISDGVKKDVYNSCSINKIIDDSLCVDGQGEPKIKSMFSHSISSFNDIKKAFAFEVGVLDESQRGQDDELKCVSRQFVRDMLSLKEMHGDLNLSMEMMEFLDATNSAMVTDTLESDVFVDYIKSSKEKKEFVDWIRQVDHQEKDNVEKLLKLKNSDSTFLNNLVIKSKKSCENMSHVINGVACGKNEGVILNKKLRNFVLRQSNDDGQEHSAYFNCRSEYCNKYKNQRKSCEDENINIYDDFLKDIPDIEIIESANRVNEFDENEHILANAFCEVISCAKNKEIDSCLVDLKNKDLNKLLKMIVDSYKVYENEEVVKLAYQYKDDKNVDFEKIKKEAREKILTKYSPKKRTHTHFITHFVNHKPKQTEKIVTTTKSAPAEQSVEPTVNGKSGSAAPSDNRTISSSGQKSAPSQSVARKSQALVTTTTTKKSKETETSSNNNSTAGNYPSYLPPQKKTVAEILDEYKKLRKEKEESSDVAEKSEDTAFDQAVSSLEKEVAELRKKAQAKKAQRLADLKKEKERAQDSLTSSSSVTTAPTTTNSSSAGSDYVPRPNTVGQNTGFNNDNVSSPVRKSGEAPLNAGGARQVAGSGGGSGSVKGGTSSTGGSNSVAEKGEGAQTSKKPKGEKSAAAAAADVDKLIALERDLASVKIDPEKKAIVLPESLDGDNLSTELIKKIHEKYKNAKMNIVLYLKVNGQMQRVQARPLMKNNSVKTYKDEYLYAPVDYGNQSREVQKAIQNSKFFKTFFLYRKHGRSGGKA